MRAVTNDSSATLRRSAAAAAAINTNNKLGEKQGIGAQQQSSRRTAATPSRAAATPGRYARLRQEFLLLPVAASLSRVHRSGPGRGWGARCLRPG